MTADGPMLMLMPTLMLLDHDHAHGCDEQRVSHRHVSIFHVR
jgi:hypothetical protein